MRLFLLGGVVAMLLVPPVRPQSPTSGLDPAGKWTFSTNDPSGAAVTGTMEIAGQPGSYRGSYTIDGRDQKLPITDVVASGGTVIMLATDADGGTLVVKMSKDTDGKLKCVWGPMEQVIPATITKVQ